MIDETKKRKSKRLSKSEEEKRTQIISQILNKWVRIRDGYSDDSTYYYAKHVLGKRGKSTRIYQIIISKFPEQDGIWEISNYDIGYVFDAGTKRKMIELKPKVYDCKYGLNADKEECTVKTYDEVLKHLKNNGYVTDEELHAMLVQENFYLSLEEIKQTFKRNDRKVKEA